MSIPIHAKKVFQGVIFSVWQWNQTMYDGTTATFEAIKRTGTIQVIPTIGSDILLSYEEQPGKERSHTFFGGRQEENEDPLDTAKRELREETGYAAEDWKLFKTYESKGKIQWPTYLFIARNCRKVTDPVLDSGERIEIKKVGFDEFLEIVSREDFWGQQIAGDILRIRLDPKKLSQLKQELFHS